MRRISHRASGVNGGARSSPPKIPIWEWTKAVAKTKLPPPCKLILFNIARHLNEVGGKGWPITIKQMQQETGLSNGTFSKHIPKAVAAGLLEVASQHNSYGHRTTTVYIARLPDNGSGDPQRPVPEADLSAPDASRPLSLDASGALSLDVPGESLDARDASLDAPGAPQESSQSFHTPQPATPPNLFKPGADDWLIPFSGTDVPAIIAQGKKAPAAQRNGGKEPERLPFTFAVLRQVQMLGVATEPLLERFTEKTAGRKIKNPSGYLLAMAHDEIAKREGVPAEIVKHATSKDPKIRAFAQAAVVSDEPRQLADVLAKLESHVLKSSSYNKIRSAASTLNTEGR